MTPIRPTMAALRHAALTAVLLVSVGCAPAGALTAASHQPRAAETPATTPARSSPTKAPATAAPTAAPATPTPVPTDPPFGPTGPTVEATVVRVIDGDTIRVDIAGTEATVRYIGIDTPETRDLNSPVEWMGAEATAANVALVEGRTVTLEKDVSETDRFDRLLRNVWLRDGDAWLLVNLALVARGFAQVTTYPPDVKYVDLLLAEQVEARGTILGLWGPQPTPKATPKAAPKATPAPTAKPKPPSNCDPAYPDLCVPVNSADLDCAWVYAQGYDHITVLPPDPHGFDGNDDDGIGCESP